MKYLIFIFSCSLFIICSPNKTVVSAGPSFRPAGMVKIPAAGKSFLQGANDTLASVSDFEKPPMTTSFTYDYWIDTIEVTQKMYSDLTGKQPVSDTSKFGKGDRFPVYNVSWYDAVLFCNARSKKDGLDTVYSYVSTSKSAGGSLYDILGLRINYDRGGYRLPTEAEWEFAARQESSYLPYAIPADSGFAEGTAWYSSNSTNQAHQVGSLQPNSLGIHDMAGNVFEWTNDWKGPYVSKITDPLGAPDPDNALERVIKGGSFEHGFFNLRPSRRSATYPISLSTTAEFLGFRCALGAISAGNYITADTNSVRTNPTDLVLGSATQAIGTSRAKLVFVNVTGAHQTLCFVDFSSSYPHIHEFTDMDSVYLPSVSPDGHFAAFCTRGVGFNNPSTVFIRSLDSLSLPAWKLNAAIAYVPRWWINRTTNDTFLIYTNSSIMNIDPSWASTQTFRQKMAGGKPSGNPQAIVSDGSFPDGLSPNGQYLASGYPRLLMRDIVNNVQRQLFVSPLNGKDSSASTQVCNVSISPDTAHPDRCLFLDFGSNNAISTLTQSSYGIHQYIFISEFSGKTLSWYNCPPGEAQWDYPEWSTAPQLAVASCRSASGDAHAIYLVNVQSGLNTQVIQGTELAYPYLWVGDIVAFPQNLSMDSLAAYNVPLLSDNQNGFAWKMYLFWQKHQDLQIAFVGSSQISAGIDCRQIPNFISLNLGISSAGITTCVNMVRDYIIPQCPQIKMICMSATPYWLAVPGGDGPNVWNGAIGQSNGFIYDENHNFWRGGLPAQFENAVMQVLAPQFSYLDTMPLGYFLSYTDCAGWGGSSPDLGCCVDWTITDSNYIANFNTVAQLAQDLAALKIHFLMINFPESPAYKNTDHYGRDGPSWPTGKAVMAQFQSLGNGNPYFHFYDAYQNGNHDYTDEDAANWNHLCHVGAAKISARLDSLIQGILAP